MNSEDSGRLRQRKVARLHLRSTVEGVDHVAIEDWCLRDGGRGWAGVGWGLWDDASDGIGWDEYAKRSGGVNDSVQRLHDLPTGSLIWTRRRDSSYWLGELTGPWRYQDGPEAQALDMFNVRPCRWWLVGTQDAVPGKVVSNFNASMTLNPVADAGAVRYTARLYMQLRGKADNVPASDPREVVESLLGALDLEDLVAAYLQDQHDLVLVNRGKSTVGYEYVLRHRTTGRKAVATVKSGGARVDYDALPAAEDVDVWAYAVSASWRGYERHDVRWISTDDLVQFMRTREQVLPDQVVRWLR